MPILSQAIRGFHMARQANWHPVARVQVCYVSTPPNMESQ